MNKIITADNIGHLVDYLKNGIHISDLLPNDYGKYINELKVIAEVNQDEATIGNPRVVITLEPESYHSNNGKAVLKLTFKGIKFEKGAPGKEGTYGEEGDRAPKLTEPNKEGITVLSYNSTTKVLTITPNPNCNKVYKN